MTTARPKPPNDEPNPHPESFVNQEKLSAEERREENEPYEETTQEAVARENTEKATAQQQSQYTLQNPPLTARGETLADPDQVVSLPHDPNQEPIREHDFLEAMPPAAVLPPPVEEQYRYPHREQPVFRHPNDVVEEDIVEGQIVHPEDYASGSGTGRYPEGTNWTEVSDGRDYPDTGQVPRPDERNYPPTEQSPLPNEQIPERPLDPRR